MADRRPLSEPRRKAAVLAGCSAAISGASVLTFSHGHPALGIAVIALQVVLLVMAIRFLALSNRSGS